MREREKDEESMRIGKERKSPGKTNMPKLYAYNECEHSVHTLLDKNKDIYYFSQYSTYCIMRSLLFAVKL